MSSTPLSNFRPAETADYSEVCLDPEHTILRISYHLGPHGIAAFYTKADLQRYIADLTMILGRMVDDGAEPLHQLKFTAKPN